jgi:hypothetical protein
MMNGSFERSSESEFVVLLELVRSAHCENHSNSVKLEKIDVIM